MQEYNAYGELYDQRPELIIHDRLKHSGMIREIIEIAEKQNFNVQFGKGPFRQDMIVRFKGTDVRPAEYSASAGLRYFKRLESLSE